MQIKLYDLRKNEKRLTQKEIADYLGISTVSYREKEKGRVAFNSDEMFKLSYLFEEPMDQIFLPRKHQNGYKNKQEA
ncbi:helix-turn-helix domain-containing protein [Tetragenococcus koreensis]|uniref:helix-turn-helix transcriptional regulator n=1 Tax=Tetragenococcus TaxID=51668 RepID=UPI001F202BC0|nr:MULTISPECIES: helix-turn-helix transcriptional regulator [Tetragenococcus]MCF1585196.1 helix-turn-helix domain-containing protein [Tetragenococcus koreensis]MCF1628828.1 helix-turn-helix domain-containing protein [Tetragenococcus koreensis]MCF1633086.1 helix-turn-helix domain-containing protein [Tetragenococcus koreensis]MCO8296690.1 helix-turn-helix transcriptional regulator [Tetragenococcus halophilus]MDN6733895.1 helix-turn-helix domain-containing protein [Tetragenococcus koreensis]